MLVGAPRLGAGAGGPSPLAIAGPRGLVGGWAAVGPRVVAALAIGVFLLVSLRHLDAVPQVYEDEPWQASTAYTLSTAGVFGSDLFQGLHGMDQRYYGFMPLHPLALAVDFRLLGVGLEQARLESVSMGLLTLLLTYALGARLFGGWVGALATLALVFVRCTGLTYVQLTGIPLIDFSRIARYDPLVPVFGLGAVHAYVSARQTGQWWWYLLAGLLSGLAGLAHLYGLFWLPALLLLAWLDGRPRAAAWIGLGVCLPWLPYAAYVLADLPDWRGQTQGYADRFDLLDPRWYLNNLLQEYHRYGPGLGPPGPNVLLRVGFWATLLGLPLSLAGLMRQARRQTDATVTAAAARTVLVPVILFPILFALFIRLKLANYTLIELPLDALVLAWGFVACWEYCSRCAQRSTHTPPAPRSLSQGAGGDKNTPSPEAACPFHPLPRRSGEGDGGWGFDQAKRRSGRGIPPWELPQRTRRWAIAARAALVALVAAVVVEGSVQLIRLDAAGAARAPYPSVAAQLHQALPSGARVLGLHTYWFGLQDLDYRSFLVPLTWSDEGLPFDVALERVAPSYVLLDPRMRAYFASPEGAAEGAQFSSWLRRHAAQRVASVEAPVYGRFEIYRLEPAGAAGG